MNLVITYTSALYANNVYLDFLPSFRKFHPDDKVIVFCWDVPKADIDKMRTFDVEVKISPAFASNHAMVDAILPVVLEFENAGFDHIARIDGGDVFFQANVFDGLPCGVCFCEERTFADRDWGAWALKGLPEDKQTQIRAAVAGKRLCNAGVFFGTPHELAEFYAMLSGLVKACPNVYGSEQLWANYLARTWECSKIIDSTYNHVAQDHPWHERGGLYYNDRGQLIRLMHNAGSRPVPRIFDGKNIARK